MRRSIYLVIAAGAVIIFGTSRASAQVINGCIKSNGTLKIVANPADCTSRETPISWNQEGPQGEPGEPGEPGIDGSDANVLHVFDANNVELGPLIEFSFGGNVGFYSAPLDTLVRVTEHYGQIQSGLHVRIFFAEFNCQGAAFVEPDNPPATFLIDQRLWVAGVPGGTRFYTQDPGVVENVPTLSRSGTTNSDAGASCDDFLVVRNLPIAKPLIDVTGGLPFSVPIPGPFRVGLPPE